MCRGFPCCRRKQDEVEVLEETIRQRNEQHKKAGMEMEATCNICLKTKFADGVGHVCNYCSIRCCARCGGKVTLRSTKRLGILEANEYADFISGEELKPQRIPRAGETDAETDVRFKDELKV
ncbi:hypothetical protein GE061_017258 [Apolygus lucorum]|uniref:RIM zinc finger domain-containing protein n=1 Tax=Apolygus lucorum TaxID=248454 RepID=A0A8S9XAN8_APOLU|nr:hypothetical protein GE061_017258 [Apolygus lucorum]